MKSETTIRLDRKLAEAVRKMGRRSGQRRKLRGQVEYLLECAVKNQNAALLAALEGLMEARVFRNDLEESHLKAIDAARDAIRLAKGEA